MPRPIPRALSERRESPPLAEKAPPPPRETENRESALLPKVEDKRPVGTPLSVGPIIPVRPHPPCLSCLPDTTGPILCPCLSVVGP